LSRQRCGDGPKYGEYSSGLKARSRYEYDVLDESPGSLKVVTFAPTDAIHTNELQPTPTQRST